MKRPKLFNPRRPFNASAAKARTKKDAAVQLVVLEFGVSRLERELEHTRERMAACTNELAVKTEQRRQLLKKLSAEGGRYG
jgi:hypothetical protein